MSSLEMISILSKPWADVNDIKKIAFCGRDNATKIRDDIANKIKKDGKYLPISKQKLIPMTSVIDYLQLDINHISLMAEQEKKLKN